MNTQPINYINAVVLQWFVDRVREVRHFKDMLEGKDPVQILLVRGVSGVGKTSLLGRLRQEAVTSGVPVAFISFSSSHVSDDLWIIQQAARMLGEDHFKTLEEVLNQASEVKVVLQTGSGEGGVHLEAEKIQARDIIGRDRITIKDSNFTINTNNPELYRIWQERLNQAFFKDLVSLGSTQGAVFLIDSYQRATEAVGNWVQDALISRISEGSLTGVRVVIAGERVPDIPIDLGGLYYELSLDPFAGAEVRKYLLDNRGLQIPDEVVSDIYEVTRGLPLLVALIADNPDGLPIKPDADKLLEILIAGLLKQKDPNDLTPETLRYASIPEWFDALLLSDLLGTKKGIDDRLANLPQYSFITREDNRFKIATPVRKVLIRSWDGEPLKLLELQRIASVHFDQRASSAADPGLRVEMERQAIGHWLVVDEGAGRSRLLSLYEKEEASYRLTFCEQLLLRAEETIGLTSLTLQWLKYLRGRLALARNDYKGSTSLLENLLTEIDEGTEIAAMVYWTLGQSQAEQGLWAVASNSYNISLQFFEGVGDKVRVGQIELALGEVHLQQAQAMGVLLRPILFNQKQFGKLLRQIPSLLVSIPFLVYAWLFRRWRFLPPLQHGMNYRNWTLARLLLTAAEWFQEAEQILKKSDQIGLLAYARQGLARTYYLLGWWHKADDLFHQASNDPSVVSNPYQLAHLNMARAEMDLASGNVEQGIQLCERSEKVFERFQDTQAYNRTLILLGQAYLREKGGFDRGLSFFRESINSLITQTDKLGIVLALSALHNWMESGSATSTQMAQVQELVDGIPEKTYLPRVPDRVSASLEIIIVFALPILAILGLTWFGVNFMSNITSIGEFLSSIFSITGLLTFILFIILWVTVFTLVMSLVGLLLISWASRRKFKPEKLNRIVTNDLGISVFDYQNIQRKFIPWDELRALQTVEWTFWKSIIPLFSDLRILGKDTVIRVPASILGYDLLKKDILDHLLVHQIQPIQQHTDTHILRSNKGLLFVLSPFIFGIGTIVMYDVIGRLPGAPRLETPIAGQIVLLLMVIGLVAVLAGPYEWLVLHPLRARLGIMQRIWIMILSGGLGLAIVANAFLLSYFAPFMVVRNMLDLTITPLGFLLLIITLLGAIITPTWVDKLYGPVKVFSELRARLFASFLLLIVILTMGFFAFREWIPDLLSFQGITLFYRGDYQGTIEKFTNVLDLNPNIADGYFYRARSYKELGEYPRALVDLGRLIDSGSAIAGDYVYRASIYYSMNDLPKACQDLRTALNNQKWSLSSKERSRIQREQWDVWGCSQVLAP